MASFLTRGRNFFTQCLSLELKSWQRRLNRGPQQRRIALRTKGERGGGGLHLLDHLQDKPVRSTSIARLTGRTGPCRPQESYISCLTIPQVEINGQTYPPPPPQWVGYDKVMSSGPQRRLVGGGGPYTWHSAEPDHGSWQTY